MAFAAAGMSAAMARPLTPDEIHVLKGNGAATLQKHVTNGVAEWADAMLEHFRKRWELP